MKIAFCHNTRNGLFALVGSAAFFAATPNAYAVTTFSLKSDPEVNFASDQFSVDGILLKLSTPTGSNLSTTPLNTSPNGLCSYFTIVSSPGARCGTSTVGETLNGFSLQFDKSVYLKRFDVTRLNALTNASISFASGLSLKQFNNLSTGLQFFNNPFLVSAGSIITVTTAGSPFTIDGAMRIANLEVELAPDPVPGPLPLFGACAAFAHSRKLRTRISKQSA
jgi:hypothetical protein